jgi:hypothetical protein
MSLRRLPIAAAIAVLLVVSGLIAGMWLMAWVDDWIVGAARRSGEQVAAFAGDALF